jgi:hypothetical protein
MNEFCLITTKSIHDYNQSAIPTTATTIPLYTNLSHYIKNKSREKDENLFSEFLHKDNIKHLSTFHEEKSFNKRSSINSIAFQFPNFVHITKSKKKQTLRRRFFFTFICLFVIILAIILTIVLIVRFS